MATEQKAASGSDWSSDENDGEHTAYVQLQPAADDDDSEPESGMIGADEAGAPLPAFEMIASSCLARLEADYFRTLDIARHAQVLVPPTQGALPSDGSDSDEAAAAPIVDAPVQMPSAISLDEGLILDTAT